MSKFSSQAGNEDRKRHATMLRVLQREFGESLISVLIFGSIARGETTASSDMDVLVVSSDFPKTLSGRMERLTRVLTELEKTETFRAMRAKGMNTWVQFHPLRPEEAKLHRPIYLDMVEDSITLHDKDNFMKNVLAGLKERLRELGARRVILKDGTWYWDLKPDIRKGEVVEV